MKALLRWSSTLSRIGQLTALAALYFGTAKLGLAVASAAPQVTLVWPPTGIALAAVLLLGFRVWPAIALGAFLANVTTQEPASVAAGIALGNTMEAVIGAWLLRRFQFRTTLERLRDVSALVVLVAVVATAVSATIGVASLCLGGVAPWHRFPDLWLAWWFGDGMGALIVAPLVLVWVHARPHRWPAGRAAELSVLLLALVAATSLTFGPQVATTAPYTALAYVVFPFVIWAALRFGPAGAALITFLTALASIVQTLRGGGPFALETPHRSLVMVQAFLALVALTGLFLAAAISERDRAERERSDASSTARERLEAEIGRRRELEEELRQRAAALANADRRKDEFLAMLGHELRNPLSALSNAVHLLALSRVEPALQGVFQRQTSHLGRLVDDLLDVSRITRGDFALRRQRLDLRVVVADALESFARADRELEPQLPSDPLFVEADRVRLEQVVTNLLHNASKFSEPTDAIRVVVERDGDRAVVRVEDEGAGISEALLPHVFDLFTQGDRSLDRAKGGLGIGLTLVRRIVELHGGEVEAHSAGEGLGSRLTVRLPLATAGAPDVAKPPGRSRQPASDQRVLIVDDHRDSASSLGELLRLEGYEVEVAHDGPSALAAARAQPPDAVLLDLGLPEMDGFEVARRLRRIDGLEDVLLVAVTGYGRRDDRARSRDAGIDHHLVKPVALDAVLRILEGSRAP